MQPATIIPNAPERRPTWQIAADIANAFDPETGEIDTARVDALTAELADKAEAIHHVITDLAAQAAACREERARLGTRAESFEARADRLRTYLLGCMSAAGVRKLQTALITASVRQGSERVEVADVAALPAEYTRTKVEPDKGALKEALKAGKEVPGATLISGADTVQFR